MSNDNALTRLWIVDGFRRIPLPYPITCFLISVLWNLFHTFPILNIGTMIKIIDLSYLLGGIIYLTSIMIRTFERIGALNTQTELDVYNKFMIRFRFSKRYWYSILFLIILPQLLTFFSVRDLNPLYWMSPNFLFNDLFKLFNIANLYSILDIIIYYSILSYVIWIILNILLVLLDLERNPDRFLRNINIYKLKSLLDPLRKTIFRVIFYFFILVTLNSLNLIFAIKGFEFNTIGYNLDEFTLGALKLIYLLKYLGLGSSIDLILTGILIIYGSIFFIVGLKSLKNVLKWKIDLELNDIFDLYQNKFLKFKQKLIGNEEDNRLENIDEISKSLEILRKEMESIMKIRAEGRALTTVAFFIITIIPPIVALLNLIVALNKPSS